MEQTTNQDQNISKLKKWGWWAVAGLAAVLVIAGLVIAIVTSGPKPTEQVAADDTNTSEQEQKEENNTPAEPENNNKDEQSEQTTTPELPAITETPAADLPKTGPEDTIIPILGAGLTCYLIALGISTIRRRN